jgi:hypothetical protein
VFSCVVTVVVVSLSPPPRASLFVVMNHTFRGKRMRPASFQAAPLSTKACKSPPLCGILNGQAQQGHGSRHSAAPSAIARSPQSPCLHTCFCAPHASFALHSALIRFSRRTASAFTRTYHPSSKIPSENRGPRRSMQPLGRCALPCQRMAAAASCGGRCCRCDSSQLPNAHCFRYSPSACFPQLSRVRLLAPVLLMRSLCPLYPQRFFITPQLALHNHISVSNTFH